MVPGRGSPFGKDAFVAAPNSERMPEDPKGTSDWNGVGRGEISQEDPGRGPTGPGSGSLQRDRPPPANAAVPTHSVFSGYNNTEQSCASKPSRPVVHFFATGPSFAWALRMSGTSTGRRGPSGAWLEAWRKFPKGLAVKGAGARRFCSSWCDFGPV